MANQFATLKFTHIDEQETTRIPAISLPVTSRYTIELTGQAAHIARLLIGFHDPTEYAGKLFLREYEAMQADCANVDQLEEKYGVPMYAGNEASR